LASLAYLLKVNASTGGGAIVSLFFCDTQPLDSAIELVHLYSLIDTILCI